MKRDRRRRELCGGVATGRTGRVDDDRAADPMLALMAATSPERHRGVALAEAFGHAERTAGNAAVQRLVEGEALPVQRWAVELSETASCDEVSHYLQTKSPHKPMAAKTYAHFSHTPSFEVSGKKPKYVVTVSSANVELETSVDMPEWTPEGKMQRPWAKGVRELRDHEGEHEGVAERAKSSITKTLEEMKIPVSANSPAAAKTKAFNTEKTKWLALLNKHAKEQKALDPYYVNLGCK